MKKISFNKPHMTGKELHNINQAHNQGMLAGDGCFTKKCQLWLEESIGCRRALLTHSCTAALEMAALLIDVRPGDEIIMPSFTFVSTANAFVLRGGVPVFVDIRPDTLNIDETRIESAISSRTKAIVPVHYAGVGCEMDAILDIAKRHDLFVIEDAAQAIMSTYKGKPLGSMGHLAALSFHETKNVISGEGGALLINDKRFAEKAEIIREKGTNRSQFFRGEVDKYTWVDVGSSYLPGELIAAFLLAQLEEAREITQQRLQIWYSYHDKFKLLETTGKLRRPILPNECRHNAHMYYLLTRDLADRDLLLKRLYEQGVHAVFHYIPLHSSPAGRKYGYVSGGMEVTDSTSSRLLRLPLWVGMQGEEVSYISELIHHFC
jgi:dTDP-4-amino-4,6-dideoxygalactose transaminase